MLPAPARLRRREDFTLAVRRGRRAGRRTLVAHLLLAQSSSEALASRSEAPAPAGPAFSPGESARAGFVVGRAVGNSVVRHRTARQLRHLVRDRYGRLPAGSILVVRALPPAAGSSSPALARDLDAALDRLLPVPAVTS